MSRGGSVIVSPNGSLLGGPGCYQEDDIFIAEVDFADCEQLGDDWVVASRARRDAFAFTVDGLDMKTT